MPSHKTYAATLMAGCAIGLLGGPKGCVVGALVALAACGGTAPQPSEDASPRTDGTDGAPDQKSDGPVKMSKDSVRLVTSAPDGRASGQSLTCAVSHEVDGDVVVAHLTRGFLGRESAQYFASSLGSGEHVLVSQTPAGDPSDGVMGTTPPSLAITDDGTGIGFEGQANDLVDGVSADSFQIYFRDLRKAETVVISTTSKGRVGSGNSIAVSMDGRGDMFTFRSQARLDTDGRPAELPVTYAKNRFSGEVTLVGTNTGGTTATSGNGEFMAFVNDDPTFPEMSIFRRSENRVIADEAGRFPAFNEDGAVLCYQDPLGDIWARFPFGEGAPLREQVSVNSEGARANDQSRGCSISADGNLVAFDTNATNMGGPVFEGIRAVLRNREEGITTSIAPSRSSHIAPDGKNICLIAQGLLPEKDPGTTPQVYVINLP